MSHAVVLVAVDAVNPDDRTEIEAAVQFQMEPYCEGDEWFKDGSRWDWYVIGGRFTGWLSDYNPRDDPRNWEPCGICNGTGLRPNGLQDFGQEWVVANNGCNGCQGKKRSVKFILEDFDGDVIQVKKFSTLKGAPAAFLRNRHWHEGERLGWFGCTTATECETKHADDPDVLTRRCHTIGTEGAHIVTWNEPYEIWSDQYRKRFIEPLNPETVLVVVDYHV